MIAHRGAAPRADDGYVVHPIAAEVSLRVTREMPGLAATTDAEVERIWRQCHATGQRLFNGRVFCADRISPDLIEGHMTEFRRLIAQIYRPELFADLRLRVVAACGVLRSPDGYVFGRRPADAVYQPGLWQLVPAGSVDASCLRPDGTLDARGHVLTELREEIGLTEGDVSPGPPICLVEHPFSHVGDMAFELTTRLTGPRVKQVHASLGNGEYEEILFVPDRQIESWLAERGDAVVPSAALFLAHAAGRNGQV